MDAVDALPSHDWFWFSTVVILLLTFAVEYKSRCRKNWFRGHFDLKIEKCMHRGTDACLRVVLVPAARIAYGVLLPAAHTTMGILFIALAGILYVPVAYDRPNVVGE
mmetsp:Transcript_5655/g.9956  ORF Transcript_5655/g.9956 Transcript_5655/m.9956 type:complete len:107 (-) Transcript_5655:8-328(-)